tara:strand:+ start:504 stop:713 length:210 start_codon:yes stop_codon:yes gene_type:complete
MVSKHSWIYILHIILVTPLFFLSGFFGEHLGELAGNDDYHYFFLFMKIIGVVVAVYHIYRLIEAEGLWE